MADSFYELFDLVSDAIVIYKDSKTVYFNPPAESLLGRQALGLSESEVFDEISTLNAPSAASINLGSRRLEAVLAQHGEARIYRLTDADAGSELSDLADALSGGIGEVVLNQQFAADVVRPYLDGIDDEQFRDTLAILEHNSFRIMRDVGNVAALGSAALLHIPGSESCFDLCSMLTEVIDSARFFLKDRRIDTVFPTLGSPMICASRADIERIVLNLISNSIKYSARDTAVTVSVRTAGGRCLISVSDEGCGIPESRLADVFSAYRLTRPSDEPRTGVGLGLAVVRRLTEKYDGTVLIESRVGVGTTVTVSLPQMLSSSTMLDDIKRYPTGASGILTTLADVLPSEYYCSLYLD